MHSLRDVLKKSEETRVAIGHFNREMAQKA